MGNYLDTQRGELMYGQYIQERTKLTGFAMRIVRNHGNRLETFLFNHVFSGYDSASYPVHRFAQTRFLVHQYSLLCFSVAVPNRTRLDESANGAFLDYTRRLSSFE